MGTGQQRAVSTGVAFNDGVSSARIELVVNTPRPVKRKVASYEFAEADAPLDTSGSR